MEGISKMCVALGATRVADGVARTLRLRGYNKSLEQDLLTKQEKAISAVILEKPEMSVQPDSSILSEWLTVRSLRERREFPCYPSRGL